MSLFVLEFVNYWPGTSYFTIKHQKSILNFCLILVFFLSLCGTNVLSPALWRLLIAKRCNCINSAPPWKDERQHISTTYSTWTSEHYRKIPLGYILPTITPHSLQSYCRSEFTEVVCVAINAQIKDKLSGSDGYVLLGRVMCRWVLEGLADCSVSFPPLDTPLFRSRFLSGMGQILRLLEISKWSFTKCYVTSSLGDRWGLCWFTRSNH